MDITVQGNACGASVRLRPAGRKPWNSLPKSPTFQASSPAINYSIETQTCLLSVNDVSGLTPAPKALFLFLDSLLFFLLSSPVTPHLGTPRSALVPQPQVREGFGSRVGHGDLGSMLSGSGSCPPL